MEISMKVETDKDGKIEKLPLSAVISNALGGMAWPIIMCACAQWLWNTYRANKKGRLEWPVTLDIFNLLVGESYVVITDRLHQYGIATQMLSLNFELWPDNKGIGLRCSLWVPRSQAAMADDILRQYSGQTYYVDSPLYGKGYTYGEPWGVYAKPRSWDEVVSAVIFSLVIGRSVVKVGKKGKDGEGTDQALPTKKKSKATVSSPVTKRRRPAKMRSTVGKLLKGIWNA